MELNVRPVVFFFVAQLLQLATPERRQPPLTTSSLGIRCLHANHGGCRCSGTFYQNLFFWQISQPCLFYLVVEPTHLKKYSSDWIISPGRGENTNCLKPPPSFSWRLFKLKPCQKQGEQKCSNLNQFMLFFFANGRSLRMIYSIKNWMGPYQRTPK